MNQRWKNPVRILTALLLILSLCYIGWGLSTYSRTDGYYRWQESACVLAGVDPVAAALGQADIDPEIGALNPQTIGNVPWTYLLSNLFYPGFLPYKTAMYVSKVVFLLLLALTLHRLIAYLKRRFACTKTERWLCVGLLFCSYMWFATLRLGNLAAFTALSAILLMTFDHERHPVLAGVLYALLAMKPQNAGPFLLYFLLKKRFKAIGVAAGIIIACTAAASILTGTPVLELILTPYTCCVDYVNVDNYIYYGLLDPLVSTFDLSPGIVMPVGVLLGIVAVMAFSLREKRASEETGIGLAALLSVCWMYSQPSDMIFLGLSAFACAAALLRLGSGLSRAGYVPLIIGLLLPALPVTGRMVMAGPFLPLLIRLTYILVFLHLIRLERATSAAAGTGRERAAFPMDTTSRPERKG